MKITKSMARSIPLKLTFLEKSIFGWIHVANSVNRMQKS